MAYAAIAAAIIAAASTAYASSKASSTAQGTASMNSLMGKRGGGQKQPFKIPEGMFEPPSAGGGEVGAVGGGGNMMGHGAPKLSQFLSGEAQPGYQPPVTMGTNPAEQSNQLTWLQRMLQGGG